MQQALLKIDRLEKDFCDLDSGLPEINRDYLHDKCLLVYRQQAINLLKKRFKLMKQAMKQIGGKIRPEISLITEPSTYSTVGKQLYEVLPEMGLLDEEIVSLIGEPIMKIDDISSPLRRSGLSMN